MRADDRLVADQDDPVLGMGPGVIEGAGDDLGRTVIAAHRVDRDADPGALGAGRLGRGLRSPRQRAASSAGARLELDREAALVVAAVRTDVMRQLHLVAVRALLERRDADGEVCTPLALAGMRDASLGYTHGVGGSFGSSRDGDVLAGCSGVRDLARRSSDRRRSVARNGRPCQRGHDRDPVSGRGPFLGSPQTSSQSTRRAIDSAIIGTIAMTNRGSLRRMTKDGGDRTRT